MHKPVHASVAYGFDRVEDLVDVFQGKQTGYAYSRQFNPTVTALEQKITSMERGVETVCLASGMAAIGTLLFALLRQGDHFISSTFLFGNTNSLFGTFSQNGLKVSYVDATSVDNVARTMQKNTKLVFVETIANPRTQVSDLDNIGKFCEEHGLVYVVDNTMTSPYLYQPLDSQGSLVVNSLTKYVCGHGNTMGGAITETGKFNWSGFENIEPSYQHLDPSLRGIRQIRKKGLRDFGATLAPEVAHDISIGSETLALRMERECESALRIAKHLDSHPKVRRVYYPGLPCHSQFEYAKERFLHPGAIFSFELIDDIDPFDFLNRLNLVITSTNLGDNRTLGLPVAPTIYFDMQAETRSAMGIADSLIRISVGIEDCDDLIADFEQAFTR